MASRTKNAVRNILTGFMYNAVGILFPFLTRTILIYVLGVEYVGLGSLFNSLLNVLSLAEAGIGSALVYKMYQPIAEGDIQKVNALYNFYKYCYRIIGLIMLIMGLILLPFLHLFIKSELLPDVNLYVLYIVYLANTVLSYFLFAYKNSLLTAHQRNDINNKISITICFLQNMIECLALFFFRNYYCYVIVIPLMTIVINLVRSKYVDRMFPQYVCEGQIEKDDINSLKKQVGGLLFSKIGDIALTNVDTIVISAFWGLGVLGKYNNYYYIIATLFTILGMINSSIVPSVGNIVFTKSKTELQTDYQKFSFLYIAICSWFSIFYLCLVQPFIEIWIGKENQLDSLMVVLLTIYLYVSKINDMTWVYRQASGLWWEGKWIPFISAIFNLITNLCLVQAIGLPAIVISTILCRVFIMLPAGSHNLFRIFFQDIGMWKRYMAYQAAYAGSTVVSAVITYLCCMQIKGNVWMVLIGRGVICLMLPLPVFCVLNTWHKPFAMSYEYVGNIVKKQFINPRY